jgi:hypothetical protein
MVETVRKIPNSVLRNGGRLWMSFLSTSANFPLDGQGGVTTTFANSLLASLKRESIINRIELGGTFTGTTTANTITLVDSAGTTIDTFPIQAFNTAASAYFKECMIYIPAATGWGFKLANTTDTGLLLRVYFQIL